MNKEQVIQKVKKLLSLANSDNENEAKLAASNASKILAKYNLSMQEIAEDRVYEESEVGSSFKSSQEDKWILPLLKDFFFVRPIISIKTVGVTQTGRRKRRQIVKLLGDEANTEVAKYVYIFLKKEYDVLFKSYRKQTGCPITSKDSYYHGLTWGLKEQLKKTVKDVEQETGLVLVNDAALDNWIAEKFPKLKNHTANANIGDRSAQGAGIEDGKNIKIRKGLGDSTDSQKLNQRPLAIGE